MPMEHNGLVKLVEECGELIQVAAKKIAVPDSDYHWDGAGSLKLRLEDEIGDVLAACAVVIAWERLDKERVNARAEKKAGIFIEWAKEK